MNELTRFLQSRQYAVAGASNNREKYGNRVFRALVASGRATFPLNPNEMLIEGHPAYASLADLPVVAEALSIITPPWVTRQVVADAIESGVQYIWMQPGAEDEQASQLAREAGITVIDDGSCILVVLARR